jgi:hypothetical protein
MCALVAFGGLAISTFADVQNIRISGDIRLRGYFLSDVGSVGTVQAESDDSFIAQRTRVTVEADLEDHVLVVATLKAEGLWGSANCTTDTAGSGINRGFDVGFDEAYVQFNEMFWSPLTLKLGRQYLQYGRGLIFSNLDQEYNFDAARLVMDFYPLTLDLVYAKALTSQVFGSAPNTVRDIDVLFVNARYENSDCVLRDVEAYVGYSADSANLCIPAIPPSGMVLGVGASPVILGLRTDLAPGKNLDVWAEAAYECGDLSGNNGHLSAWLGNVGFRYTFADAKWTPAINGNYVYASGDDKLRNNFVPWFDYAYNGYLLNPRLSNIHIFNLGVIDPAGCGQDVGGEIDLIAGYDYSKDVRLQLVYGMFVPSTGFAGNGGANDASSVAHLIRGEVGVKF